MSLHQQTATELVRRIGRGEISSETLVRACLDQINATDASIKAWAHLDHEQAIGQAQALDRSRQRGRALGPLHGIPVGIKDIFDVAGMPTTQGSKIHEGRVPETDSTVAAKLREAGAVIMGMTVSTEFGYVTPGPTRNPHDPSRTPGGSSSGSAAAVAAGHVPIAIGSQTSGSIIRPASFCGIFGLKPSIGMISRHGVLRLSETLDQVGVLGRSLEDTALLADALTGHDAADGATYARPKPNLGDGCRAEPPAEPRFVYFNLPYADRMSADTKAGFAELVDALAGQVDEFDLPASFAHAIDHHRVIHEFEVARDFAPLVSDHRDQLTPALATRLENGRRHGDEQYAEALATIAVCRADFEEFLHDYDAILTLSATGVAPVGLESTGDPVFSTIWTFCGFPSVSLPLLAGADGMPIGVQLVSSLEDDARLCRTANWLVSFVADEPPFGLD